MGDDVSHLDQYLSEVRERIKREESGPIADWNDSLRKDSCGHWRADLAKLCEMVEERDAEIARLRTNKFYSADELEMAKHRASEARAKLFGEQVVAEELAKLRTENESLKAQIAELTEHLPHVKLKERE